MCATPRLFTVPNSLAEVQSEEAPRSIDRVLTIERDNSPKAELRRMRLTGLRHIYDFATLVLEPDISELRGRVSWNR